MRVAAVVATAAAVQRHPRHAGRAAAAVLVDRVGPAISVATQKPIHRAPQHRSNIGRHLIDNSAVAARALVRPSRVADRRSARRGKARAVSAEERQPMPPLNVTEVSVG